MSLPKTILVTTIAIAILLSLPAGKGFAKRTPAPESIVSKVYVRPLSGHGKLLGGRVDGAGNHSRIFYPDFKSDYTTPREIAIDFLTRNKEALGISGLQDLKPYAEKRSLGADHIRFAQIWHDIPVFASDVLVNVGFDGRITSVISDYKQIPDLPSVPSITASEAVDHAFRAMKIRELRDTSDVLLVVYSDDEVATLCWKVLLPASTPLGDWQVFVDAITGEVVSYDNIMCFVDGSGYTFDPNPIVSEQNLLLADSNDNNYQALTNARFDVVLRDLNAPQGGYYYLSGPYVNTGPTSNRAHFTDPDSFYFNRQDDRFEEAVVYYQIDSCERFYQALGFTNIMDFSISVHVNGVPDDNSWYSPSQLRITYGYGGVDDAEDGDVIIHEYGHATQFDQVPNWGQSHEGGSMGEGFGDYLTVGFFHPISGDYREAYVFDWDANPRDHFWPGRRVDTNKHYPEDMQGEVHADGEIWSRCLWDIQNAIGHDTTVQLVLESHFYLTPQADFFDGANAIAEADINFYNGRHLIDIGRAFVDRGILDELPIQLEISHSPLNDVENVNGPYTVLASFVHTNPLDSTVAYYRYAMDTAFTMLVLMPTGNPDEYSVQIPGPGLPTEISYYIRAVDSYGISTNLPSDAPNETFRFFAGPDTILPVIDHQALGDFPDQNWPPTISATITDNIGVDSAWVEFRIADSPWIRVPMFGLDTTDVWEGELVGSVIADDTVRYRIGAMDYSSNHNVVYLPSNGYYSLVILETFSVTRMTDGFNIPDNYGRLDTIIISDLLLMYEVDAFVDIEHPSISELFIFVQSPRGERVILHNRTGGDGDSIVGWYDDELTPDGPGSFDQMVGDSSQGLWIFYVADRVAGQTGVVNSWGLRIIGTGVVDDVSEEGEVLPETFTLRQNYPNPFNPATSISFALPEAAHARLDIFDVLGRRVATLIDSDMPAGFHTIEWHSQAQDGRGVASGIYFAKLVSGTHAATIRMSFLK